jgi:hypothetical protein
MTFGEYVAYSMGINRRRAENWEMVRKLAFVQASCMGGMEATEQEFMPLPYDQIEQNETESDKIDIEEYTRQFRELIQEDGNS